MKFVCSWLPTFVYFLIKLVFAKKKHLKIKLFQRFCECRIEFTYSKVPYKNRNKDGTKLFQHNIYQGKEKSNANKRIRILRRDERTFIFYSWSGITVSWLHSTSTSEPLDEHPSCLGRHFSYIRRSWTAQGRIVGDRRYVIILSVYTYTCPTYVPSG